MAKALRAIFIALLLPIRIFAQPDPQIQSVLSSVSPDSLMKTVRELTGASPVVINGVVDTIQTRRFDRPGNEKAFYYLKSRLSSYGISVDSQVYSSTGKNLFGIIHGIDTNKVMLIGAHYDNVGMFTAQGADDNATGVAAVIECARLCTRQLFAHDIVFVLWDEEEAASTGSRAFFQVNNRFSGKNILGYINLDMLGWDGNNDSVAEIHYRSVAGSGVLGNKALAVNTDYNLGLQLETVTPGSSGTDAASFWDLYRTAIAINEDYNGDFNPHYHTINDTVGNINIPYFSKLTKLALGTLLYTSRQEPSSIELRNSFDIFAYPNPATATLILKPSTALTLPVDVVISDCNGRQIHTQRFSPSAAEWTIPIRQLNAGSYIIECWLKGGRRIYKGQFQKL